MARKTGGGFGPTRRMIYGGELALSGRKSTECTTQSATENSPASDAAKENQKDA